MQGTLTIVFGDSASVLLEAVREAGLERIIPAAIGEAARALDALERSGLLHPLQPRMPGGPVYGVDGGLARLRLGGRLVALLHAVAVRAAGPPRGPPAVHAAAVVAVSGSGPEAEAALEAALASLEAEVLGRAARSAPADAVFMLDGPIADPPWLPEPTPQLEEASRQLHGSPEALVKLHERRSRTAASLGARLVGVVKRLTSPAPPKPLAEAGLRGPEEAAARSLLAAASARAAGACLAVAPLEPPEPAARLYPRLRAALLLCPHAPTVYRVEASGDPLEAAALAASLTPPGLPAPTPVQAAHEAARVPRELLRLLLSKAAGEALEEAGAAAAAALLAAGAPGEHP